MAIFKTIGILGGVGPVATAHFYNILLKIAQVKYSAIQDADFPHIIIDSLSFKGSSEFGVEDDKLALKQLKGGIDTLVQAGAEVIVMPCNSIHKDIDKLREYSKVPIISIVEEVIKKVKSDNIESVAVLSSKSSAEDDFYDFALKDSGINSVHITKRTLNLVEDLILDVMGGRKVNGNKSRVIDEINRFQLEGIQATILGCTELPVAINQSDTTMKLYDSIEILAQSVLDYAVTHK